MADWTTISALSTAGGTLVLAAATFASVRTAHRAARATERALLAGIRPVLVPSRMQDPPEKVGFVDDHWIRVDGGRAVVEVTEESIYIAIALRNVGSGLAVLSLADRRLRLFVGRGVPIGWSRDGRWLYTKMQSKELMMFPATGGVGR